MKIKLFHRVFSIALILTGLYTLACPWTARGADSSGALARRASSVLLTSGSGGGGMPVGSILTWPRATNPAGWDDGLWLECDGRAVDPAAYPELFAAIGPAVPDLRGLFLRGAGGNSSVIGEIQQDAVRSTNGTSTSYFWQLAHPGSLIYPGSYAPSGAFSVIGPAERFGYYGGGGEYIYQRIALDLSHVWGDEHAAEEFRPINIAVRYLMRARP